MMAGTSSQVAETVKAFELLGNERRFYTIMALRDEDGCATVDDLAREVASREYGRSPEEISDRTIARVRPSLYHSHLPRLQEGGVVEYRSTRSVVKLADNVGEVDAVIDAVLGR